MAVNVEKVRLAIGRDELAWARERAERDGTSVSAVMTAAARAALDAEAGRSRCDAAWVDFVSWATDGNGVAEEALAAAHGELGSE